MLNVNNLEILHTNHLFLLLYKYKHFINKPMHNFNITLKEKNNVCNKLFCMMSSTSTKLNMYIAY